MAQNKDTEDGGHKPEDTAAPDPETDSQTGADRPADDGIEDAEIVGEAGQDRLTDDDIAAGADRQPDAHREEKGADDADTPDDADTRDDADTPDETGTDSVASGDSDTLWGEDAGRDDTATTTEPVQGTGPDAPRAADAAPDGADMAADAGRDAPLPGQAVVVERRGGIVQGFIGGLIAVIGVGFAAPYVVPPGYLPGTDTTALQSRVAEQADILSDLQDRVEALPGPDALDDLSGRVDALAGTAAEAGPTEEALAALDDRLATLSDQTGERLDALDAQVDELARRPIEQADDPEVTAALRAYEADVEALREELARQMEQTEQMVADALAEAEEARAEAEARIAEAERQAELTERQQALVDVRAALESGQPFADALAVPSGSGLTVPAALSDVAADGVPTLAALQANFPDTARAALATAREETAGETVGDRLGAFLEAQLGTRSLAPREGDSPDAVLSRAEAAVRDGRLTDAVAELDALPDAARTELEGWVSRATTRAEAVAAADDLAAELATN